MVTPPFGASADMVMAPIVSVGAVVWKGDRVLLIRRGQPPAKGTWSLPGGRQDLGETVFEAACREVLEETGVTIHIRDIAAVVDLIERDGTVVRHHFTVIDVSADWLSGEAVAGDDAEAVAWADPGRLDNYRLTEEVKRVIAISAGQPTPGKPAAFASSPARSVRPIE